MIDGLLSGYRDILATPDLGALPAAAYSGIFLPVPMTSYSQSPYRVMVVGQETKGWHGKLEKFLQARQTDNLAAYLQHSQSAYESIRVARPGRSKFGQFMRRAEKKLNLPSSAIHWANLLACDYLGRSTLTRPLEERSVLQELSLEILGHQIDVLQPHAILFVSGPNYDFLVKRLCERFLGGYGDSTVVSPRKLWKFESNSILCFRTTHPRVCGDEIWRTQALSLIKADMAARGFIAPAVQ